jgi:hypothetical protein
MNSEAGSDVARRVGFRSALIAFIGGLGYVVAQVLQLFGVLAGPWDGILIYAFSLVIAVPFMVALIALHHQTPPERQFWSHAALIMSVVYVTYVTLNYVVQLAVVIPRLTTQSSIDVLDQTPHSLCWTLDGLGYIFLGAATWFAVPVFKGSPSARWVRRFFLANGVVTPVVALVYFYPKFSIPLLLLALPWAVTAPGSFLSLALMFNRDDLRKPFVRAWRASSAPARSSSQAPSRSSARRSW